MVECLQSHRGQGKNLEETRAAPGHAPHPCGARAGGRALVLRATRERVADGRRLLVPHQHARRTWWASRSPTASSRRAGRTTIARSPRCGARGARCSASTPGSSICSCRFETPRGLAACWWSGLSHASVHQRGDSGALACGDRDSGAASDPELLQYVSMTLDTLTVEGDAIRNVQTSGGSLCPDARR